MLSRTFLFSLLILFGATKLWAQMILRGPYLTQATSNSILIHWQTDIPVTSNVEYGTGGILNQSTTELGLKTNHVIQLNNLLAGTKYHYQIGTINQVLAGDSNYFFKTLPQAGSPNTETVRIWAVGDLGKQSIQQVAVINSIKPFHLQKPIDAWLILGDIAYPNGTELDYQMSFFNYYQEPFLKNTVLWPVVGNHDYANDYNLRTNHQIPYLNIFSLPQFAECGGVASSTERYYSWNYGNIHFVNLDSYGLDQVQGGYVGLSDTILSPQITWLKADLAANTLPWTIVSFHHPPYCMGTHNSDLETDLSDLRQKLNPVLERFNVDLVLNGHCHSYQRSVPLKGHYGLEGTYDSNLHRKQMGSGSLDMHCGYIKNTRDSFTIYAVIGSGGAVPQSPQAAWPHNAMYYSNYLDNGSLLMDVDDHQLRAFWVSTDNNIVVKDLFTLSKHVNRKDTLFVQYPITLNLNASWPRGNYLWSTGDTTRNLTLYIPHDTILTVSDVTGCFSDTFIFRKTPTSIHDLEWTGDIPEIFPNPGKESIHIRIRTSGRYDCRLIELDGKVVWSGSLAEGQTEWQIRPERKPTNSVMILQIRDDKNHLFSTKIQME
jgi:hypothetical protein